MKVIQKSGVWLWALLAALLLTVLLTATAFAGDNDFRCWTVDARQWTNQGCRSEQDGMWYLFLPRDESPADTVLSFSGSVTAASAGALDREGGTLTGAFADRDRVTLTLEGGRTETVCLRQSSLPSLRLTLNGTTLDQIHQDKDVKYPGNDLVLTDGDDVLTGAVEIKGRGNSTWREYAKKPYQIKFSKKTSVLGMPAAKKWILLANASDDSMIRTRLVYDAAEQMDFPFVTEYQYVDLWIDGQYLGVYLLGEKAEIGKGRLNLQDPAGAMFELDNGFATDEDHYFFEGRLNSYFALKEIVEEDDGHIQQAMTNFQTAMTRLTTALTSQGWENLSLSQLNAMIDVDSLARYYLMNEYVLNGESFFTSFFWYQDGASDVLHVGPLWDFDTCMGNKNEKVTDYNASSTSVLMKKMLNIPAFYQRVQELYTRYKPVLTGMAGQVDGLRDEIGVSADLNYLRWSTLGAANPKPGGTPFAPTYDEALSRVRTWLTGRANAFTPTVRPQQLGYYFNASRTVMYLTYSAPSQTSLRFAVWGQQDGQDDLVWYNATANGDGTYTIRVPMCKYNVVGRYLVHVYNHGIHGQLLDGLTFQNTHVVGHTDTVASDSSTCVSAGQVKYVCRYCGASHTSSTPAKRHTVSAVVDSECRTMTVTMDAGNGHNHSNVRFAVWSSVNGQDDLTWYTAKKNASGQWTYTVPLVNHNSTGTYFIHVYSSDSGQSRLIGNTTAQVAKLPAPDTVTAQVSDNCRTMSIRLDTARSYSGIRFAVWSSAGGQDDLVWYTAKNGGSGSWTYNVPLVNHNTTGTYFIHVYSGSKLVAHTTAQVAKLPAPDTVTAQVSDNCRTMSIRLDTARSYSGIRFAVWSSAGGQDDLVWYTAKNGGSGSWTYDVDLARHNTTGTYFIHVYAGNKLVAHTTAQVKSLPAPAPGVKPGLTATVSADNAAMELALTTTAKYGKVRFAVWSNANGQDDLVWYDGRLTGSTWSAGVKLLNHKTLGGYFIHVYADGKLVAHTTANVYGMPPQQSAQAIVTDDFAWMKLRLYSATGYSSIRFAVWSSAGGQDDLVWYKGENIGGAWVAAADLTRHNTTGTYFIHIYSGNKLVAHTTVTVKSLPNR